MGGAAPSPDPAALTQQDARVISEEIHSLTLRMQVSSLVPEGSKKRKSFPSSFSALGSVCYSKMFLVCFCCSELWGKEFALTETQIDSSPS